MASTIPTERWRKILAEMGAGFSDEDRQIVQLLRTGLTQAQVGVKIGLNRSAVWRRARAIGKLVSTADQM
jgi:DNA-binding NarL/FixJ family response regulator